MRRPTRASSLLASVLCLLGLSATSRPALAWNTPGHAITGAIAYQELKAADPRTLAKVVALLKRHPDYQAIWLPKITEAKARGVDPDEMLLMLAARWPDDARSRLRGREPWHYVNLPFSPNGRTATQGPEPGTPNILTAFAPLPALVRGIANPRTSAPAATVGTAGSNVASLPPKTSTDALDAAPDAARAEALCWIMHLVGDIHQPLHTVSLFRDPQFAGKKGDAGGNLFYVKAKEGRATINLHSLWDGSITASQNPREWEQTAILLRASHKRASLPELKKNPDDFGKWAQESYEVARQTVYQGGTLQSGQNKGDGAALPAVYLEAMKSACETRMSLAGYRLADTLTGLMDGLPAVATEAIPASSAPPVTPEPGVAPPEASRSTGGTPTEGQVWVNTKSGVYWKPGTRYYGKTKEGRYMAEADAVKAGYRAAKGQ